MKLIDIMKRYNKCILKENAKLRSIYNTLIRECDGADGETDAHSETEEDRDADAHADSGFRDGTYLRTAASDRHRFF